MYSSSITGEVSTVAGSPHQGYADGNGKDAKFNEPYGIYYDEHSQSLLVCDYSNNKLRRVKLNGTHLSSLSPKSLSCSSSLLSSPLPSPPLDPLTRSPSAPPFNSIFSLSLLRRCDHYVRSSKTSRSGCDIEWDHPGGILRAQTLQSGAKRYLPSPNPRMRSR